MSSNLDTYDKSILNQIYDRLSKNNFDRKFSQEDKKQVLLSFSSNYLNSLNVFLDDDIFSEKCNSLPKIFSNVANKVEKDISTKMKTDKKDQTKVKQNMKEITNLRFLVYEFKNTDTTHEQTDQNIDFRLKMTNPIKIFLFDNNEKLRKFAFEQIINGITTVDSKRLEKAELRINKEKIIEHDHHIEKEDFKDYAEKLERLIMKYDNNPMTEKEIQEHNNFIKVFDSLCESNKIITLNQKIDFYVYLRGTTFYQTKELNPKRKVLNKSLSKKNESSLGYSKKATINKTVYLPNNPKEDYRLQKKGTLMSVNTHDNKNIRTEVSNVLSSANRSSYVTRNLTSNHHNQSTTKQLPNLSDQDYLYNKYIKEMKSKYIFNDTDEGVKILQRLNSEIMFRVTNSKKVDNIDSLIYQEKIKYLSSHCEIDQNTIMIRGMNLSIDSLYSMIYFKQINFKFINHLNLSKCHLTDFDTCLIVHMIDQFSKNIEYLNLSNNSVSSKTCDLLSKFLSKSSCLLKSLNISYNNIGDQCFSTLSLGLSNNTKLSDLYIAGNSLGKLSSIIIGTILRYDKKLELLDLSSNIFDENVISYVFKGLISNSYLKVLMLNNLNLTTKSINSLETTLYINSYLKELHLDNNNLNNKSCEIISRILAKNKYIEYVSILGNPIDNDGIDIITENKKSTVKLVIISKKDLILKKIGLIHIRQRLFEYFNMN